MCPMTSCSTKCARKRWCTRSMIGEASGSTSRASSSISSPIARPRDALAHERLVDVEMEEAHLGVGHLRQRLSVDAHQLQQRHQREAGREDDGHVAQQLEVVVGQALDRRRVEAHREEHALDQGGFEAGVGSGGLERVGALVRRQQPVDEAEGQPPALGGSADLGEGVPALAQTGDDPRLGHCRPRPAPAARPGHDAVARPAAQRLGRHARSARRLAERHDPVGHGPRPENQRRDLDDEGPAARGLNVPRRRPMALVR